MKKTLALLCSIILVCICVVGFIPIHAASPKEYSVKVGKKLTLKTSLKNAVWGSSDTSIAKVSRTGKVTAKAVGECLISAVADGKADVFRVRVTKATSKAKKLKIDSEGKYGNVIMNFHGHDIEFNTMTVEDFMKEMGDGFHLYRYSSLKDEYLIDIYANTIISSREDFYLEKDGNIYGLISLSPQTTYLKDMIVTDIRVRIDWDNTYFYKWEECYYFSKQFTIKNAPSFDTFKDEIVDKFDDKNNYLRLYRQNNCWYVYIATSYYVNQSANKDSIMARSSLYPSSDTLAYFIYTYDPETRECIDVDFWFYH